jgi:hypothetical protein
MTRRQAVSQRLAELMTKAEQTFSHDGTVVLPPVIIKATEDAWSAFALKNYRRTEELIPVIEFLVTRNKAKFEADRAKFVQRQTEIAALR